MISQEVIFAILLVIASVYAIFDVFNKRNIPNVFVYASLIVAFGITLTYGIGTIEYSILIAAVSAILGYLLYKKGFIGGGDIVEFIAISLILPIQPATATYAAINVQTPFIISVLLAAGYVVSLYIPIYYLRKTPKKLHMDRNRMLSGTVLLLSYAVLIAVMYLLSYINAVGVALLGIIGIASFLIIIFESSIYWGMVSMLMPKELEPGDMIATNLMDKKDLAYFKNKSKNFNRLVTKKLLSEIRGVKKKIPVYRNSVPFALFILIGIIISLLFGNLMLLIIS
jgi:hypothetical protein